MNNLKSELLKQIQRLAAADTMTAFWKWESERPGVVIENAEVALREKAKFGKWPWENNGQSGDEVFRAFRRYVFMNFVQRDSPVKEEDLTLEECLGLIVDIGHDYSRLKAGQGKES